MDPIAFAEARLAEDYASADMLAVQGDRWYVDKDDPSIVRSTFWHVAARCSEDELAAADRRTWHIARYDPASALREVEAGRRILARHRDCAERDTGPCWEFPYGDADVCRELADLLYRWADHNDYDTAWKPGLE